MIVNPFNKIDIPEAWQNEISYQKYIAYSSLRQTTKTLNNIQKQQLDNDDFIIREIIFKNQLPTEKCDTFYDYMAQHFKQRKAINSNDILKQRREECQNKKFNFWQKCTKLPIHTKEKLQTRQIVKDVKFSQLLLPQILFLSGSILIAYVLKMQRNPLKFQLITIGFGSSLGYFYGIFNYSNQIFNELPTLPDPELEIEHQEIINYCFSLDQEYYYTYPYLGQFTNIYLVIRINDNEFIKTLQNKFMRLLLQASTISQLIQNLNSASLRYIINRLRIYSLIKQQNTALFISSSDNEYYFDIFCAAFYNEFIQNIEELIIIVEKKYHEIKQQQVDSLLNRSQFNQQFNNIVKSQQNQILIDNSLNQLNILIKFTAEQFKKQQWNFIEKDKKQMIYSYILDEFDTATKEQITHPTFFLKGETLFSPPALVNQSTYISNIISGNKFQQKQIINQYDKLSNLILLYLFEIRDRIQQILNKEILIQIYPCQFNFNFIIKENQQPYFIDDNHFQTFILQNSTVFQHTKEKCNYFLKSLLKGLTIELKLFEFFELDSIGKGLIIIQYNQYRKENYNEFEEYWMKLYKDQYEIQGNFDGISVKVKQLEYLHSTNCDIKDSTEYLQHTLNQSTLICQQCQLKINDYGSLFYDFQFYKFYECLREILISPYYKDIPGVYICPITLSIIKKKNNFEICSSICNELEQFIILYKYPIKLEIYQNFIQNDDEDQEYQNLIQKLRNKDEETVLYNDSFFNELDERSYGNFQNE